MWNLKYKQQENRVYLLVLWKWTREKRRRLWSINWNWICVVAEKNAEVLLSENSNINIIKEKQVQIKYPICPFSCYPIYRDFYYLLRNLIECNFICCCLVTFMLLFCYESPVDAKKRERRLDRLWPYFPSFVLTTNNRFT